MKTFLRSIQTLVLAVVVSVVVKATAFAQEYNCGAYGAGAFGEGDCGAAEVADTGLNVWLIRGIALLVIALAVYVVWRTAKKRKNKTL